MRSFLFILSAIIIGGGAVFYVWSGQRTRIFDFETIQKEKERFMDTLTLKSTAFTHQGYIPTKYTCQGEDVNPPLEIRGVPENTKSLVLIMDDPDAPMGTWTHWTVWNIPPTTTDELGENSQPEGTEGMTSFGRSGYGGPCPLSGTHRYFFKLFALDTELNLPPSAEAEELVNAMKNHILDQTELIGLYQKN